MFSIYSCLQTDGLHSRFNIRKLNPWISSMKDCGYGSFRTKWSVHSEGSRAAAATTRLDLNSLPNIMKSSSWLDSNFLLCTPVNSTFQPRLLGHRDASAPGFQLLPWFQHHFCSQSLKTCLALWRRDQPLFSCCYFLQSRSMKLFAASASWDSVHNRLVHQAPPPVIPASKQLQRWSSWHHKGRGIADSWILNPPFRGGLKKPSPSGPADVV